VGISIADIASGLYGYSSILAALINRGRTGRGERIDISMLECLTEWVTPAIYVWKGMGSILARAGMRHNMIVPYGEYACADGAVTLAVQNDREWIRFCGQVLDMPALAADKRFSTNADRLQNRIALEVIIEDCFSKYKQDELVAKVDSAGLPNGVRNDVPSVMAHPQLAARSRWTSVVSPAGPIPALLPPHNLAGAPSRLGSVPALGEHTEEVLAELGEGVR